MYQFRVPKTTTSLVLLAILLLCYIKEGSCQNDCVQGFPDVDSSHQSNSESLTRQFVMPQYTFLCSTVITEWEAIVHIEKQSYVIQFQIWRWNATVHGYQLVGSNLFHRKKASSGTLKGVKRTYVVESHAQLQVEPADIVGVFASDISVHYRDDNVIDVYAAEGVNHPLGGIFAPLNLDPAFNRKINGAPLIAVQTDTTNVRTPAAAVSHSETQPGRGIISTMESSRTVPLLNETTNMITTIYHDGGSLLDSAWTQHKELIIGVTICGVVLILLSSGIIVIVMLYIRARKRKRIGIETTDGDGLGDNPNQYRTCPRRSFFPFRKRPSSGSVARDVLSGRGSTDVRGIHMTVLLTESLSANTESDHSYAYINSDLISSNRPKPTLVRSKPPALPPARIAVRQNPCYSATPAASTEDLKSEEGVNEQRVENVYDLPMCFSQPRQACEYEVPIRSPSSKPKTVGKDQHVYELTNNNV